jgi:hypothetical protein
MVDINLDCPTPSEIWRPFKLNKLFTLTEGDYNYPVTFKITVPAGRIVNVHLNINVEEKI